jgi:uncharacterized membrane protein
MDLINKALKDKLIRHLMGAVFIYVLISIVVASITISFLNLMLGWNIILAFVPVSLAFVFKIKIKEENTILSSKILLVVIFLIWLLFFPNSFYVITDFIHLGGEEFYYTLGMYSGWIYTENFIGYLTLIHIFLGAFIAVFMASYSLKIMHHYFIDKYDKILAFVILLGIFLLSSIGIYIGRFLRLQSWDVLRPFTVIRQFAESLNRFSFEYIFIFILIQISLYYFIKPFIRIDEN